jgi:peptidoglycan hydrolase CwlO-like protein
MAKAIKEAWTNLSSGKQKTAIGICVLIVILGLYFWVKPKVTDQIASFVNGINKQMNQQFQKQIQDLDGRIKQQDNQIKITDQKIKGLSSNLNKLKKEKENVQVPKNRSELYSRFDALGYKPVR